MAVYALTGIDFHHLLVFQAVAGSLGAVLAYHILLELLPPRWSLAGALVYAAYPVTLLSDTLPIKEPIATVLLLLAMLLIQRHLGTSRAAPLFLAGLFLGLLLLVRENLLSLVPVLILFLAIAGGAGGALKCAGLLLAGTALAVLPVTARNCLVGGDAVLIAASGGSNLYMAFNEHSRGDAFVQPPFAKSGPARLTEDSIAEAGRLAGGPVSASVASRFWARRALRYIAGHPARSAGLLARRIWVSLGNDEIPGNYPYQYFSRMNRLIGWNPLGYGLILALGVAGWWCARGDRRALLFPAVFVGAWVSYLPFWTLDRFRLPCVLPLVAGAMFAMREIGGRLSRREFGRAAGPLAAVLALLAVALPPRLDARRRAEVIGMAYARSADLALQAGDLARAGADLDEARRIPSPLPEISLITARYLAAGGRVDEALRELAVFRSWRPDFEDAELLQARLLAARGDPAAARRVLEDYLVARPGSARAGGALRELAGTDPIKEK